MMEREQQYTLDFTSELNLRLAKIAGLRDVRLEGLSRGRVDGVVDLLKRLTIMCRERFGELADPYTVLCSVTGLGARLPRERIVSDRTIRRWVSDARELGLVSVDVRSHDCGGRNWNEYRVNFARVLELLRPPVPSLGGPNPPGHDRGPNPDVVAQDGHQSPEAQISDEGCQCPMQTTTDSHQSQATRVGGHGRTWPDMMSAPGADTVSAPKEKQKIKQITAPLPPGYRSPAGGDGAAAGCGFAIGFGREPTTEVQRLLAGVLDHWRTLAAEFEPLGPEIVGAAIDTWRLNRERLKLGPGALARYLRTGAWPVDGIVTREQLQQQAERERARKEAVAQAEIRESETERTRERELEDRFGLLADSLSDDEVRAVIGGNRIWRGVLERNGRSDPVVRSLLLEVLYEREGALSHA